MTRLDRRRLLRGAGGALALAVAGARVARAQAPTITVYKPPT